jgi:TonB family protein
MWNVSLAVLGHLADASVRVLGLALVAVVVLAIPWMRHAAARHAVWSAVLAGMLALPVLAPLLPPLAVKMSESPTSAGTLILGNLQTPSHSTSRVVPSRRPPTPAIPTWPIALVAIYVAGVVASLSRMFNAWRTCRRLVGFSELVRDPTARDLVGEFAAAQGMSWPLPQLRSSSSVIVPMTAGFSEPVILLPVNWQQWDAWKLRAVLAHELAHIRRGDWLVIVAASVNRCLFWFHPLAWWLERHLSALAEQASDDAALGCLSDAPRYASTVLDFAATLQSGSRLTYGVAMARTAKVSRRIDRILALRQPGPAIIGRRTWAAIALCALPLVYSAAALQVTQAPSQPVVRPGIAQMLTEGSKLSAAEVQQLEEQVAHDPEDIGGQGKLAAYYQSHSMADPFRKLVYRMIEQHPESRITLYFSRLLRSGAGPEDVKMLWLQEATTHPASAPVLANAASYIGERDPFAEEDLLKRARQLDPSNPEWNKLLADLLSRAIARSFMDQTPVVPHVESIFADSARAEMESSTDAGVVGTVGEFLAGGPPGGRAPEQAQSGLAEHLLNRAQSLDPANQEWPAALERLHAAREDTLAQPGPDATQGVVRIRVGAEVQQANLIQQPVPVYPLPAKQARIQGLVRFSVIIGKDGHISSVTLISGHPLLVSAAQEAVKQWVYRPTLLNGDPVEVTTVIDVQFTLVD